MLLLLEMSLAHLHLMGAQMLVHLHLVLRMLLGYKLLVLWVADCCDERTQAGLLRLELDSLMWLCLEKMVVVLLLLVLHVVVRVVVSEVVSMVLRML